MTYSFGEVPASFLNTAARGKKSNPLFQPKVTPACEALQN